MKHDELIQKYLDNELSSSEMVEFNRLLNNDLGFKTQFDSLVHIENGLSKLKTKLTINDISFINKTYHSLEPKNAGWKISGLLKQKYFVFSALLLISIIISALIWFNISNETTNNLINKQLDNKSKINDVENISTDSDETIALNHDNISEVKQAISQKHNKLTISDDISFNSSFNRTENLMDDNSNELDISIKNSSQSKNQEIVNSLLSDLTKYSNENDYLNSANTSKRIGIIYIDIYKDYAKGLEFLHKALGYSEKTRNNLFIADMLTITGKNEIAYGNSTNGAALIRKAIAIYDKIDSEKSKQLKEIIKDY